MSNRMLAFRTLFKRATAVICHDCGHDLIATENLAKLTRLGCPECGGKTFDFTFDEETAQAVNTAIGGRPCTTHG